MSDSDDSSTPQQRNNGALINIQRGRAPDFIDGPLPENAQPAIAHAASIASSSSDLDEEEQHAQEVWANGNFTDVLQEIVGAQPIDFIAPSYRADCERNALIYLVAAHRVLPDTSNGQDAMARFFTTTLRLLGPWSSTVLVGAGLPDRAVSVFQFANRLFNEAQEQVTARDRSLEEGNPFLSQRGLRLLRADLLAYAHAFIRRVVQASQDVDRNRVAFWTQVQTRVLLITTEFDDDEAQRFFVAV